ncbi:heme/hemin ABC transporter substrate-binding protein [Terasakiella pusilla]|uniref:heme/hemin ABC transporter substrate-binding protein n=1 Tax=Terasakiella pusilla TaxID=64973 RepID=UPI003AA82720
MRLPLFLLLTFIFVAPVSADAANRIVSIGGANTEILYALGMGDKIVGTDTTSTYPEEATKTEKVGYMRALSAEGVLSLKPDMVILSDEAGPPPVLAQLKQVGVKLVSVKAGRTIEDIRKNVIQIASEVNADAAGVELVKRIDADLIALNTAIRAHAGVPRLMFILQHGGGAPMVAGTKTAADSIIKLAGAENVVADYEGYKPLTPEAAVKMQPDYILVTNMGLDQAGGLDAFADIPGVNLTDAAKEKRIIAMDSLYLLGFGPRTAEAALKLRQQFGAGQS